MWFKVLKTHTMPIGIDLGSAAVKIAQLRRTEKELELVAAAQADIPGASRADLRGRLAFLSERLAHLVRENGFKGRECILALPADATVVQHVKIAKVPPDRLQQALRWELEGKVPFDPGDAVIRHVVAGEVYNDGEAALEVIVIAAPRQTVEACLEAVGRGHLEPIGLNVEPCAIVECFARLFRRAEDSTRVTLFMDLGQANTQVVVAHGAKLVFARRLPLGSQHINESVAGRLGVSGDDVGTLRISLQDQTGPSREADEMYEAMHDTLEAMVTEITKCLRYYESVFPSRPVERAIFLGGQARDRRMCQRIAQRINLPAQIGDPLARVNRSPAGGARRGLDRREGQPAWAVAIGLSLGAELPRAA